MQKFERWALENGLETNALTPVYDPGSFIKLFNGDGLIPNFFDQTNLFSLKCKSVLLLGPLSGSLVN